MQELIFEYSCCRIFFSCKNIISLSLLIHSSNYFEYHIKIRRGNHLPFWI